MCVQVPTGARKGHGPPGARVISSCGCGAEAELGGFGCPQVLQSSLCTRFLKNTVPSSEYCPNFVYLPYQICNII